MVKGGSEIASLMIGGKPPRGAEPKKAGTLSEMMGSRDTHEQDQDLIYEKNTPMTWNKNGEMEEVVTLEPITSKTKFVRVMDDDGGELRVPVSALSPAESESNGDEEEEYGDEYE
jgi:hypothetical protein